MTWKKPEGCDKCVWEADSEIRRLRSENRRLRAWLRWMREAARNGRLAVGDFTAALSGKKAPAKRRMP